METNEDKISSPPPMTYGQFGSMEHRESLEQYVTRDEVINEMRKKIDELPFSKR